MRSRKLENLKIYEDIKSYIGDIYHGRCLAGEWNNVRTNLHHIGWNARRDTTRLSFIYVFFEATRRNVN